MKCSKNYLLAISFALLSMSASADINLNVKIDEVVGSKTVESTRVISTDYNKEIVISQDGLKDKIIITLKKFSNILVNGNRINPVQIDMKVVNSSQKSVGKTHTVTSFYTNSAQFTLPGKNISLNFQEI